MCRRLICGRRPGEHVPALRAAVRLDQPVLREQGEDLAQVGLGDPLMLGDLVAGDRPLLAVHRDVEHRPDAVLAFGGDFHAVFLGRSKV